MTLAAERWARDLKWAIESPFLMDWGEDLLQVGKKQFFEVPVAGEVALTFRDAEVYPTTGGAIAVGLTVDVDYSRAGLIDGTGLVWLKARMAIEIEGTGIHRLILAVDRHRSGGICCRPAWRGRKGKRRMR